MLNDKTLKREWRNASCSEVRTTGRERKGEVMESFQNESKRNAIASSCKRSCKQPSAKRMKEKMKEVPVLRLCLIYSATVKGRFQLCVKIENSLESRRSLNSGNYTPL